MENTFIVQEFSKSYFRITTNIKSKLYNTTNITQYFPPLKQLLLISPFHIDQTPILSDIFTNTNVEFITHILPSIPCTFTFKTTNIFYIFLTKNQDSFEMYVEIICDKKVIRSECRFFKGELFEIVNDAALLLNAQRNKETLASNMYIDSDDKDLKHLFEEKLVMEIGGCVNVKYMYFLKMKDYMIESQYCYGEIEDQPVSVGGLMVAKILLENDGFMSKKEYERGERSKFRFFE